MDSHTPHTPLKLRCPFEIINSITYISTLRHKEHAQQPVQKGFFLFQKLSNPIELNYANVPHCQQGAYQML